MKTNTPFYVAIDSRGNMLGTPESSIITGDSKKEVLDEAQAWRKDLTDYEIKRVQIVEVD